jgi:hypothetical protein
VFRLKVVTELIRIVMELIRIAAIFLVFGALIGAIVKGIYMAFGINTDNTNEGMLVGVAIYILLFVLYRNKLQFSGFYKGKGQVKLSKKVSLSLISCSFIMMILAPLFH